MQRTRVRSERRVAVQKEENKAFPGISTQAQKVWFIIVGRGVPLLSLVT